MIESKAALKYPGSHWGPFEADPMSPLLDMGSGKAWDRAVQALLDRVKRQQAAEEAARQRNGVPSGH